MQGIGYVDSIIVYNRMVEGINETETYYGTRLDGVRTELTQGRQMNISGNQNTDACIVKIPMELAAGRYLPARQWAMETGKEQYFTLNEENKDFFIIVKSSLLGIDIDLLEGRVESGGYHGGYFQYLCSRYGYTYRINHVDIYGLIPRYEVVGN